MFEFGQVEGLVERASLSEVVGWCWLPKFPSVSLLVQLQINGEVIGETLACSFRPDLEAAQKRGGACMFNFRGIDIQAKNELRKTDIEVYVVKPLTKKLQKISVA